MTELTAHGRQGPYPIHLESGLINRAGDYLAPFARDGRLIMVSDRSVWTRYKSDMTRGCGGIALEPIIVAPGEMSKSWGVLKMIVSKLLNAGANRETTIVAFGGGVVGDLVGFAASILHRGCPFVQIPTTLLAQVDSSVGGKTGINTRHGKNQLGTIHEPSMVLIDPDLLSNLQPRQLRSGYAEILKIALINQPAFFDWLEHHADACLGLESELLCHAIASALQGKIDLVKGDELDRYGQRMLLNFGHSFGHAIEAVSHFRIAHGEAVALGMMLAFRLSAELGLCNAADADRVRRHLAMTGLPTRLGDVRLSGRGPELGKLLKADKKVRHGSVRFIMTRGVGEAYVDHQLGVTRVARFLSENPTL
jgi:3-dehydroquinate synthase